MREPFVFLYHGYFEFSQQAFFFSVECRYSLTKRQEASKINWGESDSDCHGYEIGECMWIMSRHAVSDNWCPSASYQSKDTFFCHDGNSAGLSEVSENRQLSATPPEVGFVYYGDIEFPSLWLDQIDINLHALYTSTAIIPPSVSTDRETNLQHSVNPNPASCPWFSPHTLDSDDFFFRLFSFLLKSSRHPYSTLRIHPMESNDL